MAARLRGLAQRCIFCTFNATKSPSILSRQLPGTVRFRSGKTKPALHVLKDFSNDYMLRGPNNLKDRQLFQIIQALCSKLKPPPLERGQQTYPDPSLVPDYLMGLNTDPPRLQKLYKEFENQLLLATSEKRPNNSFGAETLITTRERLIEAAKEPGGLVRYMKRKFLEFLKQRDSPEFQAKRRNIEAAADLRFPQEWYPTTRQFQRTWYLHVGPTNSGKTYHALKRLMESQSGTYAGPLRLLAHEVYERLNAQGIPCNLITGDDRRISSESATITSSTVEMVDLNKRIEVAVLDEIQMIGDENRGWAWTQALLGVKASEVHLCGEERTVELIQSLAKMMGDKLIIKRYNRLGPLEVMDRSLNGDLMKLEKGDCVVTFSRRNIFALQREIESLTDKRCAVIYGSLPPETRSIQARLFNDPDNEYDILVASDAVGMGLNLSVKRIVFETTVKFNGVSTVPVPVPAIKQIAGRAGRYRVANTKAPTTTTTTTVPPDATPPPPAAPAVGLVTTLDRPDYKALKYAMSVTPKPLKTAGIIPSSGQIEAFAALFPPDEPFHKILDSLQEHARTNKSLFHLCSFDDLLVVARALNEIKGLSVFERLQFCMAPISRDYMVQDAALELAQKLADSEDASALKIKAFNLGVLDIENPMKSEELRELEGLHKALLLYLWLSWRFPATFTPRETAQELKTLCEEKIDLALKNIKIVRTRHNIDNIEEKMADMEIRGKEVGEDEDLDMDDDSLEDKEEEGESVVPHLHGEDLVPSPQEIVSGTKGSGHGFVPDAGAMHRKSRQMRANL